MNATNQATAVFEVESVLRKSSGVWVANEIRLFGRLTAGSLSLGDTIRIPVVGGGYIETTVARFTEDLTDEWLGLPFYDTVQAEPKPFCVCVDGGALEQHAIAIPSQVEKHPKR